MIIGTYNNFIGVKVTSIIDTVDFVHFTHFNSFIPKSLQSVDLVHTYQSQAP